MPIYRVNHHHVEMCVKECERTGEQVVSITIDRDDALVLTRPASSDELVYRNDPMPPAADSTDVGL